MCVRFRSVHVHTSMFLHHAEKRIRSAHSTQSSLAVSRATDFEVRCRLGDINHSGNTLFAKNGLLGEVDGPSNALWQWGRVKQTEKSCTSDVPVCAPHEVTTSAMLCTARLSGWSLCKACMRASSGHQHLPRVITQCPHQQGSGSCRWSKSSFLRCKCMLRSFPLSVLFDN